MSTTPYIHLAKQGSHLTGLKYLVMMLIVVFALTACGSKSDDDDDDDKEKSELLDNDVARRLVDKYHDGKMTAEDWNKAVDIIEAFADELLDETEDAIEDSHSWEEFQKKCERFERKYTDIIDLADLFNMDGAADIIDSKAYSRFERIDEKISRIGQKLRDRAEAKFGSYDILDDGDSDYAYNYEYEYAAYDSAPTPDYAPVENVQAAVEEYYSVDTCK